MTERILPAFLTFIPWRVEDELPERDSNPLERNAEPLQGWQGSSTSPDPLEHKVKLMDEENVIQTNEKITGIKNHKRLKQKYR